MLFSTLRWSLAHSTGLHSGGVGYRGHHVRLASNTVPGRGRNLTERYRKLENTTRAKSALSSRSGEVISRASKPPNTIAGFVIPQEPRAPADDECCMSGCAVCVYDLYEEALAAYEESVVTLRAALAARDIPEGEWPLHIRTGGAHAPPALTATGKSKGAVFDAFEEMERALKEKRERRAAVEAEKKSRGEVLVGDGEQARLDLRGAYEGIRWMVFSRR